MRPRTRQRLQDKLDDAEHELDKWGFGKTPSEIRKLKAHIEKLKAKLEE